MRLETLELECIGKNDTYNGLERMMENFDTSYQSSHSSNSGSISRFKIEWIGAGFLSIGDGKQFLLFKNNSVGESRTLFFENQSITVVYKIST